MDDTFFFFFFLATSRTNMSRTAEVVKRLCDDYGMKINASKTVYFVIHGNMRGIEPFKVGDLTIESCEQYVYLGSPFTCDGSTTSAVKVHASAKMAYVSKFISFLKKTTSLLLLRRGYLML